MNSISISGSLGKDCEMRYMPNGDPVASFSVADSQGKDKPAIWWNCTLFGRRSETLSQYLLKGQAVTVIGNITEREWTDKEGMKRKSIDVRVSDVALQGGRKEESKPAPKQGHAKPSSRNDERFDDSDIPFN